MHDVNLLFICLGNICRSPIAEGVMREKVRKAGLQDRVRVDSCGTSAHHVGEAPDPGSVRICRLNGLDIRQQRSRQLHPKDAERFQWLVCMDGSNLKRVKRAAGQHPHVVLLRDFEPGADRGQGVPDPWGGGARGFAQVFEIVDRCTDELLQRVAQEHDLSD